MAIDPNKMEAFAQQGPKPGSADLSQLGKGGGDKADKSSEPEPASEDMQEGGQGRFSTLIPMLEESAEELEACCDEVDSEQLLNTEEEFDDENHDIFVESFGALPDAIKDEMVETLVDLTPEEADELATHLEGEGMIDDAERIAAYLMHVSRLIEAGDIGADDGEDDDGEDEPADDAEPADEEPAPEEEPAADA